METQNIQLKLLPHTLTKKQLFALYMRSGMTERQIRERINAIIADNRKLPSAKSVMVQIIWHCEWAEFIEQYGVPKGYKNEFSNY